MGCGFFWFSCFFFGFRLQIHVRVGADNEEFFPGRFLLRRARSTYPGGPTAKSLPSDNLTVMGSLLDDSTGEILVFLLDIRGRLLQRGPSFNA